MLLSPIGSPTKVLAQLSFLEEPRRHEELRLPVELILYIAELALQSSKKNALSLSLVSSWMRDTALPYLYSTVLIEDQNSELSPFHLRFYDSPRQLSNPLSFIHNLWVDIRPDFWPHNLSDCPRIVRLATHLENYEAICQPNVWKFDNYSSCRSFTVLGQSVPKKWAPFTQNARGIAFLGGLTHLRVLNMCLSPYIPLEHMPNLTHICLPYFDLRCEDVYDLSAFDYILQHPSLQMIVLTLNPIYWKFEAISMKQWARIAMEKDEKLYVVVSKRQDATKDWYDAKKDWMNEAKGGESIWDKAINIRAKIMSRNDQ